MEDLLACRVCLATGIKLYDMYKYKLKNLFETFSGIQVSPADNYPQYLCSYCCALLLKCEDFRERCQKAHELMKYAEMNTGLLTTSQIHSLAVSHRTGLPLSISTPEASTVSDTLVKTEDVPPVADVIFFKEEVDYSDEEPLANKVKKKEQDCVLENLAPLQKEDEEELDAYDADALDYDADAPDAACDAEFGLPSNDIEVICLTVEEQLKEVLDRKNSYNYINSFYKCEVCYKGFIQDGTYKNHMLRHDPKVSLQPQFKCASCEQHFKTVDALKRHCSGYDNGICDGTLCSCFQCGENLPTQDALREHLKTHDAAVKCEECNRSFAHSRSFSVHYQRVHLGVKRSHARAPPEQRARAAWVCEVCGKKCISNAALVYHQRTHTGEKPYQCVECPKKFSIYQRLQIHVRTHTGERPFKCSSCPKAFKHKAALNRHDRVHSGAKPYQCGHCGKTFSQSNSMKLHVRTVHLKLPAPYRSRRHQTLDEGS